MSDSLAIKSRCASNSAEKGEADAMRIKKSCWQPGKRWLEGDHFFARRELQGGRGPKLVHEGGREVR